MAEKRRTGLRLAKLGCGCFAGGVFLLAAGVAGLLILFKAHLEFPSGPDAAGEPLRVSRPIDGFDSPYIGHTGSWDGQGGAMFGASKKPDLDTEKRMGLRWTFMPVYWRKMEPDGPVDLAVEVPESWFALDAFVVAAHERGLNILMQAPVMGGNAGGPPEWAGRREEGRSAPEKMDAAAEFAGKLAERYRPGGTLARREGWNDGYGVCAWELDNEPEVYLTNWKGQAGDYAEFAAKVAAAIKQADPGAVVAAPAVAAWEGSVPWLEEALGLHGLVGSPTYMKNGELYSIGPWIDVVSFHVYEGMDAIFSSKEVTAGSVMRQVLAPFLAWQEKTEGAAKGFPCWHTEGNFDFVGVTPQEERAAWRFQFFARSFAAGVAKVVVMDASEKEQAAVKTFVEVLPDPFPIVPAEHQLTVLEGKVVAYRHTEPARTVWVLWAKNGTPGAKVEVPVSGESARIYNVDGRVKTVNSDEGNILVALPGGERISPSVLIEDRFGSQP